MFDDCWDESEINKIRSLVENISKNFSDLEIKFNDPLFTLHCFPIKISYRGKKIGILARDVFGTIRIKKKNGEYIVSIDSIYNLKAPFKKDTVLYNLSKKDQNLAYFDKDGRDYLKDETAISVISDICCKEVPEIEKYLSEVVSPLKD